MNTKGVEDGMSDEQMCGNCFNREGEHTAEDQCIDDRGHLLGTEWKPILSATNEELIEQGKNLAKNYKPGPRQAVPFMPEPAVPVEERTPMPTREADENPNFHERAAMQRASDAKYARSIASAPIPEERTAEMEQLIELLRKSAIAAGGSKWTHDHQMYVTDENGLMVADVRGFGRGMDENFAKHITAASPENILKLLDHIEGKAKAEEVQE